ncbi:unnamed protein product [Adineta steineri]|uniref:Pentapeptide repeat-containing protein n=1 Tax=Adineta steineri TaxID=433720 RepID=A0A819IFT2_9BILA|nr:unnamed protein product [Adineta steineri]CAF3912316.1 unnamed protein product [Adineta steineri]
METYRHNSLVHKQIKEIRLEEIVTMNISAIYSNDNREVTTPMEKKEKQHEYPCRRQQPQQYIDYGHTRFEWIQLIATLTVPIAIAIFTILDSVQQMNQSKNQFNVQLRIAAENRETDLHIASENRQKDLDIASENRWKDYKIAEETRVKDREVADDEQKHSMLIDHQTFLSKLILKEGVHLNNTNYEAARFVARFKTLIAFRQLDPKRKTLLFKSLYVGKLAGRLDEDMAIDLSSADLSVDMRRCEMHGSSLFNSKFIKVNFDECKGLTIEQLKQADIVSESILPNGTVYSSN